MPSSRQFQRTAVAVGLIILVALSGCAGLSDTESPTLPTSEPSAQTQSMTQTPTASPSPTATPNVASSNQTLSGLNHTGVRNVTQLIRAHQANAIETPGVVTHTTNSTVLGRSVVATVRVAATTNLTRVRYVSQAQSTIENGTRNTTTAVAANKSSVRQYTVTDGNVTLDNRRNRTELFGRALRGLSTGTSPIRGVLQRGNFSMTGEGEPNNTGTVTLRADQYAGGQLYDGQNVVAYNATVRITTNGLVHSATEHIVARRNGSESQYNFTYNFARQSVNLPPVPQVPADIRVRPGTISND